MQYIKFYSILFYSWLKYYNVQVNLIIPLIGKDGDDVIDNITCELTGTELINTQT